MTEGTVSSLQGSLFEGFRNKAQVADREVGITDLAASLVGRGWLASDHTSCLYVSAAYDTRPLTYLGPEVLDRIDPQLGKAPDLFVYLDKHHPEGDRSSFGFDSDGRSDIEIVVKEEIELFACRAELLRTRVQSSKFGVRLATVVRIQMENESFARLALAEGWTADWFVGVCDGCAFGGNTRCENQISDPSLSIPLRLGARYWVTDHLRPASGPDLAEDPSILNGAGIPLAENGRIRSIYSWRRWPNSDGSSSGRWRKHDRWVHLLEVLNPERVVAP